MDEDAGPAAGDDTPDDGTAGEDAVDANAPVHRATDDAATDNAATDDAATDDTASNDDPRESESGDPEDTEGSVAGTFAPDIPIEPEEIDLWNVVFVVLGAYVGTLVIAAIVAPTMTAQGRLTGWTIAWLTLGFAVVAALTYVFFARTSADPPRGNPDT